MDYVTLHLRRKFERGMTDSYHLVNHRNPVADAVTVRLIDTFLGDVGRVSNDFSNTAWIYVKTSVIWFD